MRFTIGVANPFYATPLLTHKHSSDVGLPLRNQTDVTPSATMYQNLTKRLTKYVSCGLLCMTVAGFVHAQEEDVPVAMAPPETVPAVENAPTEAAPAEETKLEAIDEASVTYQDEGESVEEGEPEVETATPLSEEVEDLKKAALELNRDLLILEEELLFPANSQLMVFVSLDVGKYFALDSVKLLIDDKLVASHLYTRRQNTALSLGGIQRLYLGNLKSGEHEVTAFFVGMGPDNREYKRGATILIDKDDDPKLLELKVRDATSNMQPEFEFEEWEL